MTPQEALQSKPGAPHYPMSLNRLDGITGAARVEATVVPKQRTDQILVTTEETNQQVTHNRSRTRFQCAAREEKSRLFGKVTE